MDARVLSVDPRATRSLFIGDLSFFTNEKDLLTLFLKFGPLMGVEIKRGRNSESLLYGFVEYESKVVAVEAMLAMNGFAFKGRRMRLNWTNMKAPNVPGSENWIPVYIQFSTHDVEREVNEEFLTKLLSSFGPIADIMVKRHALDENKLKLSGNAVALFFDHYPVGMILRMMREIVIDGIKIRCTASASDTSKIKNSGRREVRHFPSELSHYVNQQPPQAIVSVGPETVMKFSPQLKSLDQPQFYDQRDFVDAGLANAFSQSSYAAEGPVKRQPDHSPSTMSLLRDTEKNSSTSRPYHQNLQHSQPFGRQGVPSYAVESPREYDDLRSFNTPPSREEHMDRGRYPVHSDFEVHQHRDSNHHSPGHFHRQELGAPSGYASHLPGSSMPKGGESAYGDSRVVNPAHSNRHHPTLHNSPFHSMKPSLSAVVANDTAQRLLHHEKHITSQQASQYGMRVADSSMTFDRYHDQLNGFDGNNGRSYESSSGDRLYGLHGMQSSSASSSYYPDSSLTKSRPSPPSAYLLDPMFA